MSKEGMYYHLPAWPVKEEDLPSALDVLREERDNHPVLHQKIEIKLGEKILPVTDWHMDAWPTIDHSAPMPSPSEIADMLDVKVHCEGHGVEPGLSHFLGGIFGDHEVRKTDHEGVYEHTFTPKNWLFRMPPEPESLRDGPCIPATYHVINQRAAQLILKARAEERKQEQLKKIHRRQKRAAFRRRKRGLS